MIQIVYGGSALAGRSTNCEQLQKIIEKKLGPPPKKDFLISEKIEGCSILRWKINSACLPESFEIIKHHDVYLLLTPAIGYRYPIPLEEKAVRNKIYKESDGIIFIVNSLHRYVNNSLEAWEELHTMLLEVSHLPPIVIQYNKRDLPSVLSIEELRAKFNSHGQFLEFQASAVNCKGVWETFIGILNLIANRIESNGGTPGNSD